MAKKYNNVRERNGKYYYRFDTKDPTNGKRKQNETTGYASAKEAEIEGIRIKAEILNGTYVQEKNLLLTDWIDQWIDIYRSTGKVKERTVDVRKGSLKTLKLKLGGMKLREITTLQFQSVLNEMKTKGRARGTIQLVHTASDMMFAKAVQLELIKTNPASNAEIPSFQQTVEELEQEEDIPKFLEKEELALLLKTAKESGNAQGFHGLVVLAYTGLRVGEMCALKTTDINTVDKNISITKTLNDKRGIESFTLGTPKTKSSKRKIDVSATVITILESQTAWRNEFKMSRRDEYHEGSLFVFVNEYKNPGKPARLRFFEEFMKEMLKESKLPSTLTPHSLRHTYTSLMAEAGVELNAIQRLLGHSNNAITERVYMHVTNAKKKEAVEKLDLLMNGLL
ncbi:hypothetical protein PMSD_11755 [Paenibacillus macquariensis subsp. defensor]|nr:hypothetical protein PMSD_11755 [Paenibacillus macquariensis subsp. defensor]